MEGSCVHESEKRFTFWVSGAKIGQVWCPDRTVQFGETYLFPDDTGHFVTVHFDNWFGDLDTAGTCGGRGKSSASYF